MSGEPQLLGRLVTRCVDQFLRKHQGASVEVQAPAEGIIVFADHEAIDLVLENLLSNAQKYGAPETATEIEISSDQLTGFAEVAIRDRESGSTPMRPSACSRPFTAPIGRRRALAAWASV